jgi:ABC-type Fe3+/spermidine/putrescine transport system ATPase subunit
LTFIGDTNRFSCTIAGQEHDEVVVRSDDSLTFRVQVPRDELPALTDGTKRELFFREEQARLTKNQGPGNSFPCVVEAVQNLGSMLTYTVRLEGSSTIRATTATTRANHLAVGEQVFVEVDPADCVLIHAD